VSHHLAQVNVARPLAPLDTPLLADFMAALEPVNARADVAPGFVWRLQTEDGDATALRIGDDRTMVNMSVWTSLEALRAFVYDDPGHRAVMRRRREWFERLDLVLALWWVPAGHVPSIAEAEERLLLLDARGPSPDAFTFGRHFPAPGSGAIAPVDDHRERCTA
jgi:hypothetical protein